MKKSEGPNSLLWNWHPKLVINTRMFYSIFIEHLCRPLHNKHYTQKYNHPSESELILNRENSLELFYKSDGKKNYLLCLSALLHKCRCWLPYENDVMSNPTELPDASPEKYFLLVTFLSLLQMPQIPSDT